MIIAQTERLRLRWFTPDDAAVVLEMLNDPGWVENIGDRGVRTLDAARAYIEERFVGGYKAHGLGFWAVERKVDGVFVGGAGLIRRASLPDVDVGYGFLSAHRRQGYAREAARACLEIGATALGLHRVLAITLPSNAPSIAVAKAIGMRHDGARDIDGEILDVFAWDGAARGDDAAEIDALTGRFYAAFALQLVWTVPWLFVQGARVSVSKGGAVETTDVDAFVAPRVALFTSGRLVDGRAATGRLVGFEEHETEHRTEIRGGIAHRSSRYEKRGTLDGAPFTGAGTKMMQLVRSEDGWKISALAWEDDA